MLLDRSDVIVLVARTYVADALGQMIPQETKRELFCNVASVGGAEWHEAARNSMRAEYKVVMFRWDYEGETLAELNGVRYEIYRTFIGKGETIELYLEKRAGANG